LWSAAVVIYCLIGGYAPFDGEDADLPGIICEGWLEFQPKYWRHISDEAKDLIRSLLQVDMEERASLVDALDSDWLRRRDKESISNMSNSMSSLNESVSVFDAWVRRQNESSASLDFDLVLEAEEEESEDGSLDCDEKSKDSERSLNLDDL
jgi:serine/threonine protein kinase